MDDAEYVSTPHDKPLRREDLALEELDGEAVIYDPRCGAVHRFDALTLLVWDACDGSHSADDISWVVAAAYEVDADEAVDYVEQLIADFCVRDLLANGCTITAKVPPEQKKGATVRAAAECLGAAAAAGQSERTCAPVPQGASHRSLLSRRAVLRGGAMKLAFAAPVISTFFARPAYASGIPIHPALSAFGAGGCKNVGYSCAVNPDCCDNLTGLTKCQNNVCCVKKGKTGCYRDEDCCEFPTDSCIAGTCD